MGRHVFRLHLLAAWLMSMSLAAAQPASPILTWMNDEAVALLHLPPHGHAPPVIVVLPDGPIQDNRHEPYLEHLLASGFAAVVPLGDTPEPAWMIERARMTPALDGRRIGVLAFGGGGASLALETWPMPRALLYPICHSLQAPPDTAPLLLLHGNADPLNTVRACTALAQGWAHAGVPVEHVSLPGVGYGWDVSPLGGAIQSLLPVGGGPGRVRARPDPEMTEVSADLVTQFFRQTLGGGGS